MVVSDDIFTQFLIMLSDEDILSLPKGIRNEELYARFPVVYGLARSVVLQRQEALGSSTPET